MAEESDKSNYKGLPLDYAPEAAGRFLRIEYKLDTLVDTVASNHVTVIERLKEIETKAETADKIAVTYSKREAKEHYLSWLRYSVIGAILLGIVNILLNLIHLHTG